MPALLPLSLSLMVLLLTAAQQGNGVQAFSANPTTTTTKTFTVAAQQRMSRSPYLGRSLQPFVPQNPHHRRHSQEFIRSSIVSLCAESEPEAESVDPYKYYSNTTEIVTKEMLFRDMLEDPKVKRKSKNKKGGGGYKVLDNRDNLPFMVQVNTPPANPYKAQRKQSKNKSSEMTGKTPTNKQAESKSKNKRSSSSSSSGSSKKTRVASEDKTSGSVMARLHLSKDDNDEDEDSAALNQMIGEFHLDKSTTCGDIIEIGPLSYQVQKARCQYKYAGGQRFVMVRKILEVKEITRISQEDQLKRQFKKSKDVDTIPELE